MVVPFYIIYGPSIKTHSFCKSKHLSPVFMKTARKSGSFIFEVTSVNMSPFHEVLYIAGSPQMYACGLPLFLQLESHQSALAVCLKLIAHSVFFIMIYNQFSSSEFDSRTGV